MINKWGKFWKDTEKPSKAEWIILVIILGFCFFTMYYTDIVIIYEEAFHLLDCIALGKFSEFYNYSYLNSSFDVVPVYDLLIYIIFAIWGLPVWVIHKLTGIEEYALYAIPVELWFKALLIIFLIAGAYYIKKIGRSLEMEKGGYVQWMVFAYLSSMILVLPVFDVAQVDIISIFFILGGFYYYLEGDMKRFIAFFAIAIPMKLFALFIFVPLLLYQEKRIIYIIRNAILGLVLLVAVKLPFLDTMEEVSVAKNLFNYDMMNRLMSSTAFSHDQELSVFILLFALLCIYCFYKKPDNVDERKGYAAYFAFATFMLLFMFLSECHPYWIVFLSPFLTILIFYNGNLKLNLLLEIGLSITFIIDRMFLFWGVFGRSTTFDFLFLQNIGPRNKFERIPLKAFLDYFNYLDYRHACIGVFFACSIALLIINLPYKNMRKGSTSAIDGEVRGILWTRVTLLFLYVLALIGVVLLDMGTGIL